MNKTNTISRRQFLIGAATAAAGAVAVACQPQTVVVKETVKETVIVAGTPKVVEKEKVVTATTAPMHEAPELYGRAQGGELPPLEQRLPKDPMVVEPLEEIGTYGGFWRWGVTETIPASRFVDNENFTIWSPDGRDVLPNLAKSWEVSDGGATYTYQLREGVKFSDGEPFTTDDVLFWYEDMLMNKDLTPAISSRYKTGDDPLTVEKIDDYTVKVAFTAPSGLWLQQTCQPGVRLYWAKHYFQEFHPGYVSEGELAQKVKDAGFDNWWELFGDKQDIWTSVDMPVLNAWTLTTPYGGPQCVFERSPYYWKVDTEANQLPYLDGVLLKVYGNREAIVMAAVAGEVDFQHRYIDSLPDLPLVQKNAEQGGYRVFWLTPGKFSSLILGFNLTHNDPVMREIFQNKDFRIAMSHAIDREKIINIVWSGMTEPWQTAPWPESGYVNEQLAKQYLEYDPDKANEILDGVFPEKDSAGFRLGPDGNRISFTVEVIVEHTQIIDAMELIKGTWEEVGVEANVKTESYELQSEHGEANEHDVIASAWSDGGLYPELTPKWWFPHDGESVYAMKWVNWYRSGGEAGEEPPEPTRQQIELYGEVTRTADPEKRHELFSQILQIAADQFYCVGVNTMAKQFGVLKNDFRNVPEESLAGWEYPDPWPTMTCQYFKRKS